MERNSEQDIIIRLADMETEIRITEYCDPLNDPKEGLDSFLIYKALHTDNEGIRYLATSLVKNIYIPYISEIVSEYYSKKDNSENDSTENIRFQLEQKINEYLLEYKPSLDNLIQDYLNKRIKQYFAEIA